MIAPQAATQAPCSPSAGLRSCACCPRAAARVRAHAERPAQVYQNISAYTSRLDNVVELYSRVPVPNIPGLPRGGPVVTTATLKHAFEPIGGSTSQITFEDTEVKTTGAPRCLAALCAGAAGMTGLMPALAAGGIGNFLGRLPELTLPQLPSNLRPSRDRRTSTFETLYLDNDLRITRGRRGELRIFLKT